MRCPIWLRRSAVTVRALLAHIRRSVCEGYGASRSCQSITDPYQAHPDAPPDSHPDIPAGLASLLAGPCQFRLSARGQACQGRLSRTDCRSWKPPRGWNSPVAINLRDTGPASAVIAGTVRRRAEAAILQYINGFWNTRRRHSYPGSISRIVFEARAA